MLQKEWLDAAKTVGVTAGASAPEILVQQLIDQLGTIGKITVETLPGVEENIQFKLPKELVDAAD